MKWASSSRDEWVAAACAAASGLLWAAVFPPLEWTWAVWGAMAPLWIMARRAASDRQALRLGRRGFCTGCWRSAG